MPTAPDNNQPNSGSAAPPNPIQPGQFVVAGDDQPQQPGQTPAAPQAVPAQPPPPATSLAGERQESVTSQVTPIAPAANGSTQPDPTPFTAPGAVQPGTQETAKSGGGSKIKGVVIALAVIVLLAIIGAVVYFFVLPNLKGATSKTQTSTDVVVEDPSPPPPNTGNGFGDIPESTTSVQLQPPTIPDSTTTQTTPDTTNSSPVSP